MRVHGGMMRHRGDRETPRLVVYAEARRRAALALARYLEIADRESARDLVTACEAMRVARLRLGPSQASQARSLARRVRA